MANIRRLKKLKKLKRLSEFTVEELVSSFGMYESAIINLSEICIIEETKETEREEPHVEVSLDIKALNKFLFLDEAIMIPCPDCGREQAFKSSSWSNPRTQTVTVTEKTSSVGMKRLPISRGEFPNGRKNVFDLSQPHFEMNNDILCELNQNDIDKLEKDEERQNFIQDCISECKDAILRIAGEVRKTYYCGYQNVHSAFVNFRIYDPIEPEFVEEYGKLLSQDDPESKEIIEAYEYLNGCLIIQKVGQYPSLADMQMFDVEKYRKVLEKNSYSDLTRAIGLNADGIGCGALVYLRRILERLVEEEHKCSNVDEEEYKRSRFDEKIVLLEEDGKVIIPDTLKAVKSKIYGILSKGVHESSDDECMELFPYMQFCIEQILDERLRNKELNEKLSRLNKMLNK